MISLTQARANLRAAGIARLGARAGSLIASLACSTASAAIGGGPVPPLPGVLAITSPAAYAQASASQGFHLPIATQPVTWGVTGPDAASIAIDAATGIFSQTQAAAAAQAVSGAATKHFTLVATPIAGGPAATKDVTLTFAASAAPGAVSAGFQSSFAGAAGTSVTALAGWSLSGTNHGAGPTLDGAGHLQANVGGSGNNDYGFMIAQAGQIGGQQGSMTFSYVANTILNLLLGASDYTAGVLLSLVNDNGGNVVTQYWSRTASTDSFVNNHNGIPAKSDGTFDLRWVFSDDADTLHLTIAGSRSESFDFDVTGIPVGTKAGLVGHNGSPYAGAGIKISSIAIASPATTLTVIDAPLWSADNTATYPLAWGKTKPTALQHDFGDGNWLTGTSTINNDGTATYVASSPDGASRTARFRPLNDTPVVATAPNPTRFLAGLQGLPKARFGMNEGYMSNQFASPGVPNILSDWLALGCWRTTGSGYIQRADVAASAYGSGDVGAASVGMGNDGIIHAAGDYAYQVGPCNTPEHQGLATITFASGTTISSVQNAANVQVSGTSVSFTAPANQVAIIYLHYDGSNSAGLTATLAGPGVGTGKVTTAAFRASMAASGVKAWRSMTPNGVNFDTVVGTTPTNLPLRAVAGRWTGSLSMGPITIETAVAIANEAGVDLHWNESHLASPELVAFHAQYAAAHLAPGLNAAVEHSNEVWNDGFPQKADLMLQGVRAGYAPDAVKTAAQATPITIIDARNSVNFNTRVTSAAFNAGDKLFVALANYGWAAFTATQNVASGATLPDPTLLSMGAGDANFSLLYDFAHVDSARLKQHGQRTAVVVGNAWRSAFATAGRAAPVIRLGAWYGAYANIKPAVDWVRASGATIDEVCTAPYFGFVGAIDTASYGATDLPGWTSTEKNLYVTDVAAWKDAYFPILAKAIDATTVVEVQFAADLAADNVAAKGGNAAHARDIVLGFYEFGINNFSGYPNGAAIDAAVQSLVRDPRMGTAWSRALGNLAALIGGRMDVFYRVGTTAATGPWNMADSENDFDISGDASTNWRWKALATACAANV